MSVLKKIEAKLETMAPGDRQIGQFIIDNPDQMLRLSTAALAAEIGRSQSSVVKFSQKLGYVSYQELKLAVSEAKAQEWQVPAGVIHGSIEVGDSFQIILKKLTGSKLLSMQQTVAANSERIISRALEMLDRARRIHLVGVGASSLVARDFSYKLMKLGRNVLHDSDSHVQMANVSTLGPGDVLFALSYSGASIETLRMAELARKRGTTVIAVTGLHDNPLSRVADIRLYTIADEERARSSSITARDAQLTLTDLLFILLVQKQPDANEYVHNSEVAVSVLKAERS
ncbi:MAG: MurR/RpiR family transcriptional regulator [Mesorhizobium sp.]|uniref:MurR/RpiR family transcriptional regulator n=1 Tax=unclassified Mesorhizobium TaxID=325217 RepID=UPI000FCA5E97|nr:MULTISPECIES: MurR/RpiR family transcriptional regulator [unclassified Mesorhizobium]RUU30892.1 MurR/RpiR family transcriptional regulator [Mesorhizobium sp. M6A.T.Ce.TU.016.01.1.1]RWO97009.1 MAG: MurR/RpiR family transcriptional regulator [Mesorhizobium sp.]RWP49940.1 MAG: MurR/RpiR family transcriptional regulator [Mesorhizobium sp.]RWQ42318.1 MAG: MurR/RpiR family transcriptional regulator [Mesorhizobium sp.]RWQ64436.1 MAG: MurR/RpiR family transcriptional regulator [Mesorhizobium sp.]